MTYSIHHEFIMVILAEIKKFPIVFAFKKDNPATNLPLHVSKDLECTVHQFIARYSLATQIIHILTELGYKEGRTQKTVIDAQPSAETFKLFPHRRASQRIQADEGRFVRQGKETGDFIQ